MRTSSPRDVSRVSILIELLVMIAMIAILIGLFLPAEQKSPRGGRTQLMVTGASHDRLLWGDWPQWGVQPQRPLFWRRRPLDAWADLHERHIRLTNYGLFPNPAGGVNGNDFGSAHAARIQVVVTDGSVRMICNGINHALFNHLGDRRDGNIIPGDER